jgi:alanine-glyoxylate transaminase/serine-glyoxylate transaminase/serine-pyruvate transaminase
MIYSIREALRIVLEEGLENRWARHAKNAEALVAGIDAMGLRVVANKDFRLPSLTAVFAPEGIPEAAVRKDLLENYNIEVSGGLASMPTLAGKIWRIGLMGHNSTATNVLYLLSSLESTLAAHEYEIAVGVGATAAQRVLRG